jgi:N-acetylneuraminic acid mutarotase
MKNYATHYLFYFLFTFLFSPVFSQTWELNPNFPGIARDDAAVFSMGHLHFCGTGRGSDFACTKDFYCFNSQTNTWSSAPALPEWQERQYATGFSYQDNGYILGGENCLGSYLKNFWRFDLQTYTWHALPDFPGAGRAGAQHFILNDILYWVGGRNDTGILNEVWCYHFATQIWEPLNNLPFDGIWRGIGFSNSSNGFVACGRTNFQNQSAWNAETWQYDPLTDQWNNFTAQLNLGTRMYVGATQKDSLLFVFGGVDQNDTVLNSLEKINLNSYQLETLSSFQNAPRKGCVAFLGSDFFHLSTGISGVERLQETWRIAYSAQASSPTFQGAEWTISCFENKLMIEVSSPMIGQALFIKDLQGRVIKNVHLTQTIQEIVLEDLPSGLYLAEVKQQAKPFYH